jgi:putative transport protein
MRSLQEEISGMLRTRIGLTAAMAAVQERSGSPVAVLGYTPAYAVANILLTIGSAIVVLVVAT